jgi:hypothetical protein
MQAKTQSEQELTLIINDLNERNDQQAADLIRLKSELELEVTLRISAENQVCLLEDELKKVQTAFDNERKLHQADDKSSDALMQTIQRMEQDLCTSVEEQNTLKELLENERKLRVTAENTSHTAREEREHLEQELRAVTEEQARQENDRILNILNLEEELELVRNQKKSLEKQVNVLTNEKTQAEQTVKDLTHEPDRARNAIGEKGVDHLTRDDSFVSVNKESQVWKQSFLIEETPVIKKENFPVVVESPSQVFAEETIPDTQESPGSEKKLTSSKPSSQNHEIFPKAVTDIIKTFSDDDLFEEN